MTEKKEKEIKIEKINAKLTNCRIMQLAKDEQQQREQIEKGTVEKND